MASYDYTFTSGDTVTPTKLNNARTVGEIVNADIKSDAAIALSKLATGALPTAITVASANLVDGTIVDADINASAAIAHSKLANVSAGQVLLGNASNVPTATALTGDVTVSSSGVTAIGSGVIVDADVNASAAIALSKLATGALPTAITVASANIVDGTIVNADISNSSAIALSKLANITAGQVILGNASNVPTATALSGDVTVTSSGVTAIGSAKVLTSMVNDAAVTAPKLSGAQTGSAPIFGVRAWGEFAGQGSDGACVVAASGNVTSASRVSSSVYEIVMTTALPDANYAILCTSSASVSRIVDSFTKTTTTFRIEFLTTAAGLTNPSKISFMVIR